MAWKRVSLLAVAATTSAFVTTPLDVLHQLPLGLAPSRSKTQCELPPILSPSGDGLASADELFSTSAALKKQIERHQAIVRVPSVCYDDLGEFSKDKRWEIFYHLHDVLEESYPLV